LGAVKNDDPAKDQSAAAIPLLERRARPMNKAIEFAVISGIFATSA
jgi:hypothetical protein